LFAAASPENPVFQQLLDVYFAGERDQRTLESANILNLGFVINWDRGLRRAPGGADAGLVLGADPTASPSAAMSAPPRGRH